MLGRRLIVLKFGGSVLRDHSSLPSVVHEIYRWRRDGWDVVAVVSAFDGETDRALDACTTSTPAVIASLTATGERRAASLVAVAADDAGIPVRVLTPEATGLLAQGDPLEADPVAVDTEPFRAAFEDDEVVVVPGFTALDQARRTVVLGRGGSDLTAVFLAGRLGADRCRLVKDVGGLFERDPAGAGPPPRRLTRATWDDALAIGGEIIQDRAVRHARAHGVEIELGALDGIEPTSIGRSAIAFAGTVEPRRRVRVVLLGCGVVGGGVLEHLRRMPERFEITAVAVAHPEARAATDVRWTGDALAAARSGADIVIETIGGTTVASDAILAALAGGADVVTANKTLVAERRGVLEATTVAGGTRLLCSAAVGGSVPVLERLAALDGRRVRRIRAVLNGTTNFILDRMRAGDSPGAAAALARRAGLAEGDGWRDIEGLDAADKLALIAHAVNGATIDPRSVVRESLDTALRRTGGIDGGGGTLRQVATLECDGEHPTARVVFEALGCGDPLATVRGAGNAVVIELDCGRREILRGVGAGRAPTAEAILADVLELSRTPGRHAEREAVAG